MPRLREFILQNKSNFSYQADLNSLNLILPLSNRELAKTKCCLAGIVVLLLTDKNFISSFEELFSLAKSTLQIDDETAEFLFFQGNHLKFPTFKAAHYSSDADEVLAKLSLWENLEQ